MRHDEYTCSNQGSTSGLARAHARCDAMHRCSAVASQSRCLSGFPLVFLNTAHWTQYALANAAACTRVASCLPTKSTRFESGAHGSLRRSSRGDSSLAPHVTHTQLSDNIKFPNSHLGARIAQEVSAQGRWFPENGHRVISAPLKSFQAVLTAFSAGSMPIKHNDVIGSL